MELPTFAYFYLKGKESESAREQEKRRGKYEICHLLMHSSNACNSWDWVNSPSGHNGQDWARLKPGFPGLPRGCR